MTLAIAMRYIINVAFKLNSRNKTSANLLNAAAGQRPPPWPRGAACSPLPVIPTYRSSRLFPLHRISRTPAFPSRPPVDCGQSNREGSGMYRKVMDRRRRGSYRLDSETWRVYGGVWM